MNRIIFKLELVHITLVIIISRCVPIVHVTLKLIMPLSHLDLFCYVSVPFLLSSFLPSRHSVPDYFPALILLASALYATRSLCASRCLPLSIKSASFSMDSHCGLQSRRAHNECSHKCATSPQIPLTFAINKNHFNTIALRPLEMSSSTNLSNYTRFWFPPLRCAALRSLCHDNPQSLQSATAKIAVCDRVYKKPSWAIKFLATDMSFVSIVCELFIARRLKLLLLSVFGGSIQIWLSKSTQKRHQLLGFRECFLLLYIFWLHSIKFALIFFEFQARQISPKRTERSNTHTQKNEKSTESSARLSNAGTKIVIQFPQFIHRKCLYVVECVYRRCLRVFCFSMLLRWEAI